MGQYFRSSKKKMQLLLKNEVEKLHYHFRFARICIQRRPRTDSFDGAKIRVHIIGFDLTIVRRLHLSISQEVHFCRPMNISCQFTFDVRISTWAYPSVVSPRRDFVRLRRPSVVILCKWCEGFTRRPPTRWSLHAHWYFWIRTDFPEATLVHWFQTPVSAWLFVVKWITPRMKNWYSRIEWSASAFIAVDDDRLGGGGQGTFCLEVTGVDLILHRAICNKENKSKYLILNLGPVTTLALIVQSYFLLLTMIIDFKILQKFLTWPAKTFMWFRAHTRTPSLPLSLPPRK